MDAFLSSDKVLRDQPPGWADDVSPAAAEQLIASISDITLVLDQQGIICDILLPNSELAHEIPKDWRGKRWSETVTIESRAKVDDLVRNAQQGKMTNHREINHPSLSGIDVPIRYSTVAFGNNGRMMAVGRDLRSLSTLQRKLVDTQEAIEKEYSRMRAAETRYRMLFHIASEPILIIDASSLRIMEANPAAQRLLVTPAEKLLNQSILSCFNYDSAEVLEASLKTARQIGRMGDVDVRLASNGAMFSVSASLFRQDQNTFLLARLKPAASERSDDAPNGVVGRVMGVLEQLPDGFVMVDTNLKILEANQAFLDCAQLASKAQALSEPLSNWLGRSAGDLDVLVSRLREGRAVRSFSTIVRGAFGSSEDVEVSAVPALSGETPSFGFVVRSTGIRQAINGQTERSMHRSVEQLTELVGRVSLKEMVRESSDIIERLCIEAALERSHDNRASAAQMLGLSRQSFYSKMRRHGLGDLEQNMAEED